jgi:hypothetical protein
MLTLYCKVQLHSANRGGAGQVQAAKPVAVQQPHTDAAAILGLNQRRKRGQENTVEAEVDKYLNDHESGTNLVTFWQVCVLVSFVYLIPDHSYASGVPGKIS